MLTGRSGEDFAKAHFVISATLDQGGKLTEEIVQNKALLKACCASTPEAQIGFLTAMELLIVKDKRNGIKVFDKICKTVWECDVVSPPLPPPILPVSPSLPPISSAHAANAAGILLPPFLLSPCPLWSPHWQRVRVYL
jgi:hypothetical protein